MPITDPKYYSKITKDELANILRGDEGCCEIPLLQERVNHLHSVGNKLLEKYNGIEIYNEIIHFKIIDYLKINY